MARQAREVEFWGAIGARIFNRWNSDNVDLATRNAIDTVARSFQDFAGMLSASPNVPSVLAGLRTLHARGGHLTEGGSYLLPTSWLYYFFSPKTWKRAKLPTRPSPEKVLKMATGMTPAEWEKWLEVKENPPRSKLCQQGRHDFDDATGACRRKGCPATMTRTMFPMTVAEEEQAYGFSTDRAAQGFRPGDTQQGLFDAQNPLTKCSECGLTTRGASRCWECEAKHKGLCLNCGQPVKRGRPHPARCHELATTTARTTMKKRKNSGPRPRCTGCRRFLSDAEQRHENRVCRRCGGGAPPEGSRYYGTADNPARWTVPVSYSGQDFDEIQARAQEITESDRRAGRPAPAAGYSAEAFAQATHERTEFAQKKKRNPVVLAPGAISWQGLAGLLGNPPKKGKRGHPPIHYCVSFMAGGEPVSACGATEGFVIEDKRRATCVACKQQKPMKRGRKRNPADFSCTVCSKRFGHGRALYDPISQTWYHKGCVKQSQLPAGRRLYPRTPTAEGLAKFADSDRRLRGNPPDLRAMCLTCGHVMTGVGDDARVGDVFFDSCGACGRARELEVVSVRESHRSNPDDVVRWKCRAFSSGGHGADCAIEGMGTADAPPAGWEYFPTYHRDPREKLWKDAECPACQRYSAQVRAKYGLPPKRIRGRLS